MRRFILFQILIIFISSCAVLPTSDLAESVLFSIDENPTLADEFLYVYEKNNFNNDSIFTEKDIDEYFSLFTNFKLKVEAAKTAGLDTTRSFLDEFETYKNQLIEPYLSEAKENERLVKEAYERMKYEIDASHILVTVAPDALPEDTTKAYQKILEIYEKATSGQDFGELAVQFSEDPSAKSNKGRLGYFTTFQMVYVFEEAAFNTQVDSVSDIIRSRFGYHILKVHDKRPASGKVKVSHIMLRVNGTQNDSLSVRNKIFEIHDQVIGGADWNELCQLYSEDQRTKNNGGTLPFIGLKQINDTAFENAAFGLQTPGEVSDPVRSKFGWHILKLEEKEGLESFDEIEEDLKQRVSKDDRSKLSQRAIISKLKAQNNFHEYASIREQLVRSADSSLTDENWDGSKANAFSKDSLFSINGNQYYTQSSIDYILENQRQRADIDPTNYINELIDAYIEKCLRKYEEDQLLKNNRDFRMLLNEYYEGILLFEIMNQEVWGKAAKDTTGLKMYFQNHRESYYWGERANASILSTPDKIVLENLKESINIENIKVFEINFNPILDVDVLKNPSLDSLIYLFKKYDKSTITIQSNKESSSSKFYADLIQYFDDLELPKKSIIESELDDQEIKIHLELNSKSKKSLEFLYNKESALTLQVIEGLFEKGENPLIDSLDWKKGTFEAESNGNYHLIVIHEILETQGKKLKDVKGSVISDYQNYLEKNWLYELKSKHNIEINYTTLDKIRKLYKNKLNHPG